MSDDDPQHRTYHHADADLIEVREAEELGTDDGLFTVRMPVASTGEVRNAGDDPLSRDAVAAMRDQINEGSVGVFLDHGGNTSIAGSCYSAVGKVGEWREAELTVNERDGRGGGDGETTLLMADAALMDPETLPAATGPVRESLAAIKSQVERGLGLSSSIGWRDDESAAGGVDLMEASIVGIPADPRTTTSASPVDAVARAAAEARPDADPEALVADFRAVVMGPADDDTVSDETTESGERAEADGADETPDPDTEQEAQDDDFRAFMREHQKQQTEILRTLADALRESDEDEDDDEDDDDEDEENEQSAETDADAEEDAAEERALEVDGEAVTAEDVRALREQLGEAEPDVPTDEADAETDEREADEPAESGGSAYDKYGMKSGF